MLLWVAYSTGLSGWRAPLTDDQFAVINRRFDALENRFNSTDEKIDNLIKLQEETDIKIAAIDTRLGSVERAVTRIATEVGVHGVPALSGSTRQPAGLARAAKGG